MSRHSANEVSTVEVVNVVQRRRWTIAEKLRVIEETSLPRMRVSFVARKYGIAPNQVFRWRKLMSDGGKVAIQTDDQVESAAEAKALKKRIRDLERLLGRKTMKLGRLKVAIAFPFEKNSSRVRRCRSRTIPYQACCGIPTGISFSVGRASYWLSFGSSTSV